MFAYVKSGSIVSYPQENRGIEIDGIKHSADIYTKWTESERNAIGIYTIEMNTTNFKSSEYYLNTEITYAYDSSSNKVTGSYGTATQKEVNDTKWTQAEIDAGKAPDGADTNTIKDYGLKHYKKLEVQKACASILQPSDYMALKAAEGVTMDSGWKTWRASVRAKCNSMETQIDNAANAAALETLFTYTGDPLARPIGEFPVKE